MRLIKTLILVIPLLLGFSIFQQDTYWNGAGDTPGMEAFQQNGAYLRFTDYPVHVYMLNRAWQPVLDEALNQLGTVMPIVQTTKPAHADIFIEILPKDRFLALPDCQHTAACSDMRPIGIPDSQYFRLISRIWIQADTALPPIHVLLHELLHALGLQVHSPYPEDVLYNGADSAPIVLSPRDTATLIYLYTQPAVGE